MITYRELLSGHVISDVPIDHQHNLEELLKRINIIREKWGKPMVVTSGYRSMQDHLRIYRELAEKRNVEFKIENVPKKSKHLFGQAVDIDDDNQRSLYEWCVENVDLLEQVGLWCEEKDDISRVHFQIVPPLSGKRFFKP